MKHLKLLRSLLPIAAALAASAFSLSAEDSASEPLVIQKQGSFAVGGTVLTAPGSFDPIKQGAYNATALDSAGQTLHGDHAYVCSTKFRSTHVSYRS